MGGKRMTLEMPEVCVKQAPLKKKKHPTKEDCRIGSLGYRLIPKGYIGLRTPLRPDGRW